VITVFGGAEPLDGAGGVARGVQLPPIFNFRLGVGIVAAVGATGVGVAGVLGKTTTVFAWIGTGGGAIDLG